MVERALELLVTRLEQREFAATSNPRPSRRTRRNPRCIQAQVKRAVWARDQGQCTFVSETGHRCEATKGLQFDHVLEVARGGEATVKGIRLRCGPHNQYAAERTFGADFMSRKRREATAQRAEEHAVAVAARERAAAAGRARAAIAEPPHVQEVIPWLRALGYRTEQALHGAAQCAEMADASLEERVRAALSLLAPRARTYRPSPAMG